MRKKLLLISIKVSVSSSIKQRDVIQSSRVNQIFLNSTHYLKHYLYYFDHCLLLLIICFIFLPLIIKFLKTQTSRKNGLMNIHFNNRWCFPIFALLLVNCLKMKLLNSILFILEFKMPEEKHLVGELHAAGISVWK